MVTPRVNSSGKATRTFLYPGYPMKYWVETMSSEPDVIDISSELTRKKILDVQPEQSMLGKVLDVSVEPSIIIYGSTKTGKTRLVAWEGAVLATKLNRRAVFVLTEPNVEDEDVKDIVYSCMYHGVLCEIHKFESPRSVSNFIVKTESLLSKKKIDYSQAPRVFVVDSVTALANLVIELLPHNIVESGSPTALPYIYPVVTKFFNRIRKLISTGNLGGYLLMTAHEMSLRGEKYVPYLPVKAKPRFSGVVQYMDDAELYLSPCLDALECEEGKKYEGLRSLVTVNSRRVPISIGNAVAFTFMRLSELSEVGKKRKKAPGEKIVVEGLFEKSEDEYRYIPKDMLPDEKLAKRYVADPLVPVLVCGPKNIKT